MDAALSIALQSLPGPCVIVQTDDGSIRIAGDLEQGDLILMESRSNRQTCGVDREHALRFRKVAITKAGVLQQPSAIPGHVCFLNTGG
jgi:hypothetical protein